MLIESGEGTFSGVNVAKINLNVKREQSAARNGSAQRKTKGPQSFNSQNSNNKDYYVEEKTKILENIIMKVQPVVNEL